LILKMKQEEDQQVFSDLAHLLFEQSLLSRGDQLDNPVRFVNRLNALLTRS
jgi:molecular chaperone HtpG